MGEPIADEKEARLTQRLVVLAKLRADAEIARARVIEEENTIGDEMGVYKLLVAGKTVKRHRRQPRARNWQSDDLLRLVLDTRVVDPETGEIESQVDALKKVYGLRGYQAKLRELEKRGIQVDEWCEIEDVPGWSLEIR